MKVILRENIENLGKTGDIVKVSDGYARNFLLPRKLVAIAEESNVRMMEHHKRELEKKRGREKSESQDVAKKLEGFSCTIERKVGEADKLFGSVTSADIADALKKGGYEIGRKQIHLDVPIKKLGVVTVPVKLQTDVVAQLKVWVVKENA
ncbi:MAG: 50S ribosomal protein L9 [Deltaproteobacteria bacterium]|nr:50S ribosomal protein L9 [Deltaproteobacteria bacterium]